MNGLPVVDLDLFLKDPTSKEALQQAQNVSMPLIAHFLPYLQLWTTVRTDDAVFLGS